VLEVRATYKTKAKPAEAQPFALLLGKCDPTFPIQSGDRLEYDILIDADSPAQDIRLALGPPVNKKKANRGFRVDLNESGDDANPKPAAQPLKARQWTHCASGLANYGGRIMMSTWLIIDGNKPATTYHLYLDNVIVRHADGSATEFYTSGKPPEQKRYENPPAFTDVSVDVTDAGKVTAATDAK
jgi:hypothetical protein